MYKEEVEQEIEDATEEDFEQTRREAFSRANEAFNFAVANNLPTFEPEDGYSREFVLWHMAEMIRWLSNRLRQAHRRIDKLEDNS